MGRLLVHVSKVICFTLSKNNNAVETFGSLKKLNAKTFPINAAIGPDKVFNVVNLSMQKSNVVVSNIW